MTREFATKAAVIFVLFLLGMATLKFLFGDPLAPTRHFGFGRFAMDIALGILAISVIGAVSVFTLGSVVIFLKRRAGGQTRGIGAQQSEAFNARLNDLERRVTDVQDVLISMDDKLSRSEVKNPGG